MDLISDKARGRQAAELLYKSFSTIGIHGKTDMPEDIRPKGVQKGSLEHIMFITLSVSIDYQRDANQLWESSRKSYEDPETRYLFDPKELSEVPFQKIRKDLQVHNLSKKFNIDAKTWRTVGITFQKKWNGDPRYFLEDCNWDSLKILERLRTDKHLYNNRLVNDYPFLRGAKIGPLWLRMLRDNVGITKLKNLDQVPIPVDIHVARATLAIGAVKGSSISHINELFNEIRIAWFESVKGLKIKDRNMIALDVDEPLWHLSKYGCTKRDKSTGECPMITTCEARDFCVRGTIKFDKDQITIDT